MAVHIDNASRPFGSARFAGPEDIAHAGLYAASPHALLIGFDEDDRPLWYSGMAGLLTVAGARAGKLRDLLGYNICQGIHAPTMIILDIKGGELAAISRDQTRDGKFCIYWNPAGVGGLPRHRINPLDYLNRDNPRLVSHTKMFTENALPPSGSAGGVYFEGRARELTEAICLTLVERDGMLTYPALYEAINLLIAGGESWLDFAFEMSESGFPIAVRIEEEIAAARQDSSGGFKGILGEITRAFACLSDPILLESLSPPYDFSFADLMQGNQTYNVYLMPPADVVDAWAPVVRSQFVAAQIYKAAAPAAPRQTWIVDEAGQLGRFPLLVQAYTRDAGTGIRPWAFFQSAAQMKALAPNADSIIPSSAGVQTWFGIREEGTAALLSRMLGQETLRYVDEERAFAAAEARQKALADLLSGGDPAAAGIALAQSRRQARLPKLVGRSLRTLDELLHLPGDRQIVFADGLAHPVYARRKAYYDVPSMAGRFHPNPFHPPHDQVRVMTKRGPRWRPVIDAPVPDAFAHYPQYADGTWSYIG